MRVAMSGKSYPVAESVAKGTKTPTHADRITISKPSVAAQFRSANSQVVWLGGLPRDLDSSALQSSVERLAPSAVQVEVLAFKSPRQASKYPPGSKHRGCALLACDGVEAAAAVAAELHASTFEGDYTMMAGPATKIPSHWAEELHVPKDILEERRRKELQKLASADHYKRRRKRKAKEHKDSVSTALSQLPPPGGSDAVHCHQPLNVAQGEQYDALEQWMGQIRLQASQEDCARSVSVKKTEPQRQQQRVERKLVQIESFAMVLAQILHVRGLSTTAAASSMRVAPQPSVADIDTENKAPANLPYHFELSSDGRIVQDSVTLDDKLSNVNSSQADGTQPTPRRLKIVDFGSGSGNLILPLAHFFPACDFVAIDMKAEAIRILQDRAAEAGLSNISAEVCRIEDYKDDFDVCLALHACGHATDVAMLQAHRSRAALVVSPCCVGKLVFSPTLGVGLASSNFAAEADSKLPETDEEITTTSSRLGACDAGAANVVGETQQVCCLGALEHPRSKWMRSALNGRDQFEALAKAADYSHVELHSYPEDAQIAKANIELDRAMAAKEAGFHVQMMKLRQPELTTKSDIIVGVPAEQCDAKFQWPWK